MSLVLTLGLVVLGTVGIYVIALVGIRVAGRRTVSSMSAFDVLVTVAIGTIVGTAAVRPASWIESVVAIASLLALQTLVGWLRRRSERFRRLVDFSPLVVIREGRTVDRRLHGPMSPQMTPSDVAAKVRGAGYRSVEEIEEAILENTGELSAFGRRDADR